LKKEEREGFLARPFQSAKGLQSPLHLWLQILALFKKCGVNQFSGVIGRLAKT